MPELKTQNVLLWLVALLALAVGIISIVVGIINLNAVNSCVTQTTEAAKEILIERQSTLVQSQLQLGET